MTDYLKYCLERLNQNLNRDNLDENIKNDISFRMRVIEDLIEKCFFQEKNHDDKQAIRIEWIASWKKRGKDISSKTATLDLLDEINSFIPYLKAVNNHGVFDDLDSLLKREVQLIDFGYLDYEGIHIPEREFNLAFEKFYESLDGEILALELREKGKKLKNAFLKVYRLGNDGGNV
jgi:hypothetical protein